MLRITVHDELGSLTFQLEGRLAGPWVRVLEECWQSTLAGRREPFLRLDLTGVTSIDAAGQACLAALHREGAEFVAADCLTKAVVAEITRAAAGRRGGHGDRERLRHRIEQSTQFAQEDYSMTHRLRLGIASALVLGLCLALAGCARAPAEAPAAAPPPVTVSYPVEREVTDYADFTARTAAVDSVELRARVSGYLDKVNFKEGALVKKGDVLFEIDPRTYRPS